MARTKLVLNYTVNQRKAIVTAYDSVGVEDCYGVLLRAALHRIMTNEHLAEPIPRAVKDWIIKQNLFV